MARITIKVDGNELKYFDSFSFATAIDTACSSISFRSFLDIETFSYIQVQVYRNDVLIFTGKIIGKEYTDSIPPQPFTYKAESLPSVLFDSTLPVDAYPLQLENSTLKDVVEYICSFFDLTVIFDQSCSSEASGTFTISDIELDKKAGDIINDLVTNVGLILSNDSDGNLVVIKTIEQSEITLPKYTSNNKSYDLKKFFHNYIALGQAPIGDDADIQSIATFDNVESIRNITQIQDKGGVDTVEKKAIGMRADSLKTIQQSLSFNNFFCNVGDYIVLDDVKLIVNQLDYSFNGTGEVSSISIVDSNAYIRE